MSNSSEFIEFKKKYYNSDNIITNYKLDNSEGYVVFEGEEDSERIHGNSRDFLNVLEHLVKTVRDGEHQYIDVRDVPANNKETFQSNLEYFETDPEVGMEDALEEVQSEGTPLPDDFDQRSAVRASREQDFDNRHLKNVIENHSHTLLFLNSLGIETNNFAKIYKNKAHNRKRYTSYYNMIYTELLDAFTSGNPVDDIDEYLELCKNDLYHHGNQISSEIERPRNLMGLIAENNDNIDSESDTILLHSKTDSSDIKGEVPTEIGIREILNQYSSLIEGIKPLLKDLLVSHDKSIDRSELSSLNQINKALGDTDISILNDGIVPDLRHGPSHSSVQTDEEEGIVRIYDRSEADPSVVLEMEYKKIIIKLEQIKDLTSALLHAFIHIDYKMIYNYISSEEFAYIISENAPPGTL